ncbi:MAG: hypothetical protein QMD09_09160, partial [Desulfatibacillaceae bacterium]|nr:hypothetical protein [Desulfatibacillaceae bacterium]
MRKLILWSMAVCLIFAIVSSTPALADDGGVINHGLLGVHPDIQGEVDGILQVTTVHEEEDGAEWGEYSNWIPSWGANPWSSDGEKIVYQSARIDPDTGWQQYEICTMNADGTDWQRLTNNSRCDSHASFVPPNNEKIVFQRNVNQGEGEWGPRDGQGEIWIMDADGANQISLTQLRGGPVEEGSCENKPVVSPDGQFIAFRTCGGELWVMDINGELLFPFPVSGEYRTNHHVWFPDPEYPVIIFSGSEGWGDSRIYAVLLDEINDIEQPPPPEVNGGDIQIMGLEPIEPILPIVRISPPDEEVPFDDWCENWPSVTMLDLEGEFPFPITVIAYHGRYQGYNGEGENPYGDSEVHRIVVTAFGEYFTVAEHFEGDGTGWSKIQGPTSWMPPNDFGVFALAYVAEEGGGGDFGPLFVEEGDEGELQLPYPQQSLFVAVMGEGFESIQLTEGYQDTRPWWSPDGGKILFKESNDWWWEDLSTSRDGDTNPIHRDLLVFFFEGELSHETGSLSVTIEPAGARAAGAQWRIDGGEWQNSGDTIDELPLGDYTVQFKAVDGWNAPADQELAVLEDQTTQSTGIYEQQVGNVTVTIEPVEAVNAGARWRVGGGAWQNSGATVNDLPVGPYVVEFQPVAGWTTPFS